MFGVASFHGTNTGSFSSALSYLSYNYSAPKYLQFNATTENYCEMRIIPRDKLNKTKAILTTVLKALGISAKELSMYVTRVKKDL